MGVVTPGETLGTLYNIPRVASNKTKQHCGIASHSLQTITCVFPRRLPVVYF